MALGVAGISSSTVLTEARRLVPFVERHKMFVAMHNHNNLVDPDQFATPASFEKALAMSDYFKVTLDIGHFVAGNNDPVDFIRKHHDAHREHPHPRSQAQQRAQPAVRPGRHADQGSVAAHQRQPVPDSLLSRVPSTARSASRSRRSRDVSSTAGRRWRSARRAASRCCRPSATRRSCPASPTPAGCRRRPSHWSGVGRCTC